MARVAIVGVGAIGSVVAALLEQTGRHEVVLCARRALQELVVETPSGPVSVKGRFFTDAEEAPEVDWVLVATKAYDVEGAAKWLPRLRAQGAPVAVLQNGVEHVQRFAPYMDEGAIVPVVVDCPVERPAPEHVRQRGVMHLKAAAGPLGSRFVDLFAGSAADATVVDDFASVAWTKLCVNAAGVLPALVLQPAGVMREELMGEAALEIVRECIAVGRAEGARLEDSLADEVLARTRRGAPDGINSLLADRLAGRPTEIDARNGVIVRLGRKHDIPTPANLMAVALLDAMTPPKQP